MISCYYSVRLLIPTLNNPSLGFYFQSDSKRGWRMADKSAACHLNADATFHMHAKRWLVGLNFNPPHTQAIFLWPFTPLTIFWTNGFLNDNAITLIWKDTKNVKCLKCGHEWKRSRFTEYVSFLAKCPKCSSRLLIRY